LTQAEENVHCWQVEPLRPHAEAVEPAWHAPLASQHPRQFEAEHREAAPQDVIRPNIDVTATLTRIIQNRIPST
jgi:hypothetical protein